MSDSLSDLVVEVDITLVYRVMRKIVTQLDDKGRLNEEKKLIT